MSTDPSTNNLSKLDQHFFYRWLYPSGGRGEKGEGAEERGEGEGGGSVEGGKGEGEGAEGSYSSIFPFYSKANIDIIFVYSRIYLLVGKMKNEL